MATVTRTVGGGGGGAFVVDVTYDTVTFLIATITLTSSGGAGVCRIVQGGSSSTVNVNGGATITLGVSNFFLNQAQITSSWSAT